MSIQVLWFSFTWPYAAFMFCARHSSKLHRCIIVLQLTSLQANEGLLFPFYRWGNWGGSFHDLLPKKGREGLEAGLAETAEPHCMSGRADPWEGSLVGSGDRDPVHPGPEELVLASHVLLPAFCSTFLLLFLLPFPFSSFPVWATNVSSLPAKIWETLSTSVRIAPTPRGFSFSKAWTRIEVPRKTL